MQMLQSRRFLLPLSDARSSNWLLPLGEQADITEIVLRRTRFLHWGGGGIMQHEQIENDVVGGAADYSGAAPQVRQTDFLGCFSWCVSECPDQLMNYSSPPPPTAPHRP